MLNVYSQSITGNLVGSITDKDGNPITGVIVTVSSPSLQGSRSVVSDGEGFIRLILLPPGLYSVNINHIAYRQLQIDSVLIRLGKTTHIGQVKLLDQPFEIKEVLVTDKKSLIDHTSTVTGSNLSTDEMESLPLERNYRYIPLLLPQVNNTFYNDKISYLGSTGLENRYSIDGIDATEPLYFSKGTPLPYNFIKDIEIITGGYAAEYRSSLGSVINVVTQSGGDEVSGQVFGFYTSNRFSADPRSIPGKEQDNGDYALYDLGFNIGVPIIKEKLWLNAAYNPAFENEDVLVPGIGYNTDKVNSNLFAGKLSWRISAEAQLILNVTGELYYRDRIVTLVPSGLETYLNPDPTFAKSKWENYSPSVKGLYFLSDNLLLEGSLSRFSINSSAQPKTEIGNLPVFYDYTNGTISGGLPEKFNDSAIRLSSSLKATLFVDHHIFKAGVEYIDNSFSLDHYYYDISKYSDSIYYSYIFEQQGKVGNRISSIFIQDSWRINSNWQLNAGLRWDGQFIIGSNGKVAQKILNQFQPRLGLIFTPDQRGYQKIYASYGRFYQELADEVISVFYLREIVANLFLFDHDPRENPEGGVSIYNLSGQIQEEINDLRGQYTDEFSLGYENRFIDNHKFSIRGVYRRLGEGIEDAFSTERQELVLGNPGRYPIADFPSVKRDYLALEVSLQKISSDPINYFLSYVLSRSYGNYQGVFDSETNNLLGNGTMAFDYPEMVENALGLLPNDRTHVFKCFGSYKFDFGLTIGASFSWLSGTPLSEYGIGVNNYYRVLIRQRGTTGRTPNIWDLSLRLMYRLPDIFKMKYNARLIFDVFHVASRRDPVTFDQLHYLGIDENGNQINPNPTYGQATRYFPPMSLRLGMEIDF